MLTIQSQNIWNIFFQSSLEELNRINPFLENIPPLKRLKEDRFYFLRLCISEAVSNAMTHGNMLDKTKTVSLNLLVETKHCIITVTDDGNGLPFGQLESVKVLTPSKEIGNRGLRIILDTMESVSISKTEKKFSIVMKFIG